MTESQESERRQAEFAERTQLFMESLNVDEMVAQLLVSEGFATLEEVAYVDTDELTSIDGFDENTAEELQARARESLDEINARALEHARELGVQDSLVEFEGLTPQMVERLAEDGILDLEEFARCADWELAGGYTTVDGKRVKDEGLLEKFDMSLEEAQTLVMNARVQLGWVDPAELAAADEATERPPTRRRRPTRRRKPTRRRAGPEAVTRGGRVKARDEPERRCIVTRETGPKAGLIRFVAGPDGEVVPDLAGPAAGPRPLGHGRRGGARPRRGEGLLRPRGEGAAEGPGRPRGADRGPARGAPDRARRAGAQVGPGGGGAREDQGGARLRRGGAACCRRRTDRCANARNSSRRRAKTPLLPAFSGTNWVWPSPAIV